MATAQCFAKAYPIVDIRVSGTEVYTREQVLAYTGLKVDKKTEVDLGVVEEAAKKLANSGVFRQVGYQHIAAPGGMRVEFQLTDHDQEQFTDARFQNFIWFKTEELKTELEKRIPLFNGEVPSAGSLRDELARELESMLATKGVQGHVTFVTPDRMPGANAFTVYTVEDVNIVITEVTTPGASPEFAPQLQAAAKPLLNSAYREDWIRDLVETKLRDVYLRKGYLTAEIAPPAVTILGNQPGETRVAVALPVTEGKVYNFSGLRWVGNNAVSEKDLKHMIHLYPGLSVNGALLNADIRQVRTEYARRGYMHMTMNAKPTFDDEHATVFYELQVNEGPRFLMGKLDVSSANEKLVEKIRTMWQLREGEPFNSDYVRHFKAQLAEIATGDNLYAIEESEGETANTVDVSIVECRREACHTDTVLYTPDKVPSPHP